MSSASAGYSLVELLVVIAILALLSAITFQAFQATNVHKAIDTDALRVAGELNEARSLSISSRYADEWGVHLATSSITLFEGASFAGATNTIVTTLSSSVQIATTSLSGGGSDVVFDRLTGQTTQYGSTTLSLIASSSVTHVITIYQTGVVEIQ